MNVLVFLTEYGRNRNQTRETSSNVITERWEGKVCRGRSWCALLCFVFFVKQKERLGEGGWWRSEVGV